MYRRILIALFLVSIFFISCKKDDVAAPGDPGNPGNNTNDVVYNVSKSTLLNLVNDVRQKGCTCGATAMPAVGTVAWNDQLAKAAFDHSADMHTQNYFSHTGLDGSSPGQRITAAGYSWHSYGENIANGYPNEQAVISAWLSSEGHCKNIMNGSFKDMGVGREANYWTQVFGSK